MHCILDSKVSKHGAFVTQEEYLSGWQPIAGRAIVQYVHGLTGRETHVTRTLIIPSKVFEVIAEPQELKDAA